jgi:phage replication-related protein YjqB (UPF0714/DUF867 family)
VPVDSCIFNFVRGLIVTLVLACAASAFPALARNSDRYASYMELLRHEVENVDFIVRTFDREPTGVLVIHGGAIEFGTSEIGMALMGEDWSGYFFEGLKFSNNRDLHITATRFDEPRADDFVARQHRCVSVHGFTDNVSSLVCLGGRDTALIEKLQMTAPGSHVFRVESCPRFAAMSGRNIVNRCGQESKAGLQLELSAKLRRELLADPKLMETFVSWVRAAYKDPR